MLQHCVTSKKNRRMVSCPTSSTLRQLNFKSTSYGHLIQRAFYIVRLLTIQRTVPGHTLNSDAACSKVLSPMIKRNAPCTASIIKKIKLTYPQGVPST